MADGFVRLAYVDTHVIDGYDAPVVLFKEVDGGRLLPLWLSVPDAARVMLAVEHGADPGSGSPEFVGRALEAAGHPIERVRLVSYEAGCFGAELWLGGDLCVPVRASDGIGAALAWQRPVEVSEDVLQRIGITDVTSDDRDVERFRRFLDGIRPEDFGDGADRGEPPVEG